MSMISGQIDRLRTAAQTYRKMGNHSAENMFFEAADTILQLRDDLQRANADNAELREQMDGLASSLRNDWQIEASWDGLRRFWHVGWTEEHVESCAECAKGLGAYADSLCDPLKAENAKLRELVARVERARRDLCDAYPDAEQLNCEECPAWGECRGDLMDRMRELGVEVDG